MIKPVFGRADGNAQRNDAVAIRGNTRIRGQDVLVERFSDFSVRTRFVKRKLQSGVAQFAADNLRKRFVVDAKDMFPDPAPNFVFKLRQLFGRVFATPSFRGNPKIGNPAFGAEPQRRAVFS